MVYGIGVDIVEMERFVSVLSRRGDRFLHKIFTEAELISVNQNTRREKARSASLAGRFAAKEAVIKAMGGRAKGFAWRDIEIEKGQEGDPKVVLNGATAVRAEKAGISRMLVTLSHSRDYAVACVLAETL